MCGFAGVVGTKINEWFDRSAFLSFAEKSHASRGPDGVGRYIDEKIACVHNRLAIIGGSEANQPICRNSKVLLFNGEIYNASALAGNTHKKHERESISDTLVLFDLLEQIAIEDVISKVRGMYGFAFWDKSQNKLILARDRFGEKPLYYIEEKNYIAFSSTIDPLITCLKELEFDSQQIQFFSLTRTTSASKTHIAKIQSLEPGQFIEWRIGRNGETLKSKSGICKVKPTKSLEFQTDFGASLENALSECLVSDVPVSLCLSGGVDSSAIACAAKSIRADLNYYTINFTDGPSSEIDRVKYIDSELNLGGVNVLDVSTSQLVESFSMCFNSYDVLNADPTTLPFNLLMQKIKNDGVSVALTGEGADERFFGYRVYKYMSLKNTPVFSKLLPSRGLNNKEVDINYICRTFRKDMYSCVIDKNSTDEYMIKNVDVNKEVERDLILRLGGDLLQRSDRIGMASSVEVRCPYLHSDLDTGSVGEKFSFGFSGKKQIVNYVKKLLGNEFIRLPKVGFDIDMPGVIEKCALVEVKDNLRAGKFDEIFDRRQMEKVIGGTISNISSVQADAILRLYVIEQIKERARRIWRDNKVLA